MSTNKRRKVDSTDTSQANVSAISAIAARRRLAGRGTVEPPEPPEAPRSSSVGSHNAFSILQGLSRQGNSPSQVAAAAANAFPRSSKAPRSSAKKAGELPLQLGDPSVADSAVNVQFSSFRPTKQNCRVRTDGITELRLGGSERFVVLGSFGVKVLEGEVTVAGALLRPDDDVHWVHAPLCHSLPVLRNRENTRLQLHSHTDSLALRQLGRLSPLFRKMWNEAGRGGTFQMLCSSGDAPKKCFVQELVSPPAWNKKLSSLTSDAAATKAFSVLVCGPKSSGKSTFSKILVNRLVTGRASASGVAVLDLDPGQPEYYPPGTLSLVHVTKPNLSPPFTHTLPRPSFYRLVRCHALASVSPASDTDCYLAFALDLFAEYRRTLADEQVPLVINTPGWVLGAGLEILDEVISSMAPSEVIYMSEEGPSETVEALQAVTTSTLATLPSQPSEFTARTGAHLRAMHTMSYFHSKPSGTWDATLITAMPPWQVPYEGSRAGIRGILFYDAQPDLAMAAHSINGMVLALVEVEDAKAYRNLLLEPGRPTPVPQVASSPEGIPLLRSPGYAVLDPKHSRAVGLVLIRGIDKARRELHLVTPISLEQVRGIHGRGRDLVLVHGKFDVPKWSYTEDLHYRSDGGGVSASASASAATTSTTTGEKTADGVEEQIEDTSEDDSDMEPENAREANDVAAASWVEVLTGNEKRPVGSKVWRVRRDLGRHAE
ncbi:polynucleotide 5'-hydroxyl-kinase GRC3/NOL9 [Geosmithia morbida]|uniref:Polynucleotide 5'-hydroxyl-kinase GRC3 n=1 Tax=Geosmithia morbida TaxID=1094350 RepID=A0A9P4Z265_9HYPO|nr:polynucleotide 5'-hydroxyl-kinase GRC3/NOL9 [Geosmithia morbida]KAF4126054.1 polynucleotide 5'-hydroxyl-kinase GRC3/NOL9 [Geosmithia morbida]